MYSQGFAISRDEYIIRELAFCDWTDIIMPSSNTCYRRACRTINYPRRPKRASIVRPRRCMVCRLNRTRLTTAMNFIPTNRSKTKSPVGVNSISPPSGVGWVCSRSMVCIDCSKSPGFRTPSWSWKGRAAGTWPLFPPPRSMSWPPMIRAAIGAWIIPTGNVGVESGTIIALTYEPVK